MSPRRLVMVLAMLAALGLAPSSVFGAQPGLHSATVAPSTGTTATQFVLSVGYRTSSANPATGVTATVAGKTVPLSRTYGSAFDGTWTGSTSLPAGSWTVTFTATTSKGSQPSVSYGPVTVVQTLTPPPSTPSSSRPSTDASESGEGVAPSAEPEPLPSARPRPTAAAIPAGGTMRPSVSPAPAASGTAAPSSRGSGGAWQRRSAVPRASSSPDGAAASGQPAATGGQSGGQGGVGREVVSMVLLLGIAGVAVIAMLGAAWIILASRRDRPEPTVAVAHSADPAVTLSSTMERRAMRRAHVLPSEDPILAALGIRDDEPPPPEVGQGDQPAHPRRFRRAARSARPES